LPCLHIYSHSDLLLRFYNFLEQLLELRRALYSHLLFYYEGFNSGTHGRDARFQVVRPPLYYVIGAAIRLIFVNIRNVFFIVLEAGSSSISVGTYKFRFTALPISFALQKCFSLMQSHLSILIFVPYILGSYLKRH
jgi:hypothetical protein